jgi:hypothetical protein
VVHNEVCPDRRDGLLLIKAPVRVQVSREITDAVVAPNLSTEP